jgi:hypothetical protein
MDFVNRHRLAKESMKTILFAGGRKTRMHKVFDSGDIALATGVTELYQEFAVVLVDGLSYFPPKWDLIVVVHHGVVGQDAAADVYGTEGRDDGTHSAARKAFFPVDSRLSPRSVVIVPSPGYVRPKKTVLYSQVPEF